MIDKMVDAINSENLIYNRFDLIHKEEPRNIKTFKTYYAGIEYKIELYSHGRIVDINIWGKDVPEPVIDRIREYIENSHAETCAIYVQRGCFNYDGTLMKGSECVLSLPATEEELLGRLSKKERYNIRRERRFGGCGNIIIKTYSFNEIPFDLVEQYFEWKSISHGVDYNMTPKEYLNRYHVTDAMEMIYRGNDGEEVRRVAVLFWCGVEEVAYFENFSFDGRYEKYSPGYLIYIDFLKELIFRKYKTVFLGGAGYGYKKKFDSVERSCFTGYIFTKAGIDLINGWMAENYIFRWGIYGGGNLGKAVYNLSKKLERPATFVVDKRLQCLDVEMNLLPNDNWGESDVVIIAIFEKDETIDELMKSKHQKYIYYNDFIEELLLH